MARASILVALIVALGACAERQDGGQVCPALCPEQNVPTLDTVIEDVGATAVVAPYPARGTEQTLLLSSRRDSLDTRAIIRFDSIPGRHRRSALDTTTFATTFVDSAELRLRVNVMGKKATDSVTISVYNVDTTASDTSTAALVTLFRPDRLVGVAKFDTSGLKDTLRIPLDSAFLRQRIVARQRVRLGVQVTSTKSVQLQVYAASTELGPQILFDPSPDTATRVGSYRPVSLTPADNEAVARDLTDFTLIVRGSEMPGVPTLGVLRVGGLPASRVYLRFELPARIIDSGTVLRATLMLTQVPLVRFDTAEAVTLYAHPSLATGVVSSPERAALILGNVVDSAVAKPNASGVLELDLVRVFRRWRGSKPEDQPRVLILRTSTEGVSPAELRVYDVTSASGLKPRIRITYVPRVDFGLP